MICAPISTRVTAILWLMSAYARSPLRLQRLQGWAYSTYALFFAYTQMCMCVCVYACEFAYACIGMFILRSLIRAQILECKVSPNRNRNRNRNRVHGFVWTWMWMYRDMWSCMYVYLHVTVCACLLMSQRMWWFLWRAGKTLSSQTQTQNQPNLDSEPAQLRLITNPTSTQNQLNLGSEPTQLRLRTNPT